MASPTAAYPSAAPPPPSLCPVPALNSSAPQDALIALVSTPVAARCLGLGRATSAADSAPPTISTLLLLREPFFLTGSSDLPEGVGPIPLLLPLLVLLTVPGMDDVAVRRGRVNGPLLLLLPLLPQLSLLLLSLPLLAVWLTDCRKAGACCCSRPRAGMLCCE